MIQYRNINYSIKSHIRQFHYRAEKSNTYKIQVGVLALAVASMLLGSTIFLWSDNSIILDMDHEVQAIQKFLHYILPSLCALTFLVVSLGEVSESKNYVCLFILASGLAVIHATTLRAELTLHPISFISISLVAKVMILTPIKTWFIVSFYILFAIATVYTLHVSVEFHMKAVLSIICIYIWLLYLGIDHYHSRKNTFLYQHKLWKENQQIAIQGLDAQSKNSHLSEVANRDSLTGLFNRYHFKKCFNHELGRLARTQSPLSLLIIDIDYFKLINDNKGHQVGDEYLIKVSDILRNCIRRDTDIIARYGGEEFIVLLPDTDHLGLTTLSQGILDAIREQKIPHPITPFLTVSIGGITTLDHDVDLIKLADDNLYHVKNNGRNAYSISQV
ncbi:hypothetical protein BCU68_04270 [Vibrio sp. 10N.286.49.B3]|uniref:GGDEF domain-containing protein n=1 Tax=Vibrio sp. 10N.286.49.B3 TaxID=1880855 RepID=UPI000C85256E|nr:GGDEF domain-containing protein [Vibrio sp. 10N.286.49.B3]PMH43209.1 hypothetical protein BCU68_04270 [Vibrio sp. 10N.286.49.B3]